MISADNTNTNFGGPTQIGDRNVANLLEIELGHSIFRLGCLAHIDNNAFRHGVQHLKELGYFDMTKSLNKAFSYFSQKVKAREEFRQHWIESGFAVEELVNLRNYVPTRWLVTSLSNLIQSNLWKCLKGSSHS